MLPESAVIDAVPSEAFDGVIELRADGIAQIPPESLYGEKVQCKPIPLHCIPYFAWGNRAKADMQVWHSGLWRSTSVARVSISRI